MAGGYFVTQNKVIPGAYINFTTTGQANITAGERGKAVLPLSLNWGAEDTFLLVDYSTDFQKVFGYDISAAELLMIKECLKRAKYVLVYRINSGAKATITANGLTATAKYNGTRGNALTVKIAADADVEGSFIVTTVLDGKAVVTQSATSIDTLADNDYVDFSGTGSLTASSGMVLANGSNTDAVSSDYTAFFTALEVQEFDTLGLPVTDATIKAAAATFIKRMIETEGKKVQVVMPSYTTADHEGVISVENGVVLSDNTTISTTTAVAWVTGATAAAEVNEDLTYSAYEDAVDVTEKYTNTQIETMLNAGKFFFVPKTFKSGKTKIVVQEDINTFTTFTAAKGKEFRLNRSVRTMFDINRTVQSIWEQSYIGRVDATTAGVALFRGDLLSYFGNLQSMSAIKNFADDDIEITLDESDGSVVANIAVQIVKAMKKLYMTIKLQ